MSTHETYGERAAEALAQYNNEAPDDMLTLTTADRIHYGTAALQAITARRFATRHQAARDFRALVADLFHLAHGRITAGGLWLAAQEIRHHRPGVEHSVTVLRAVEVDQCAALLAALVEAAQAHGIETAELFSAARAQFEAENEAADRSRHAAA
ncbi:hypothetical protein ACIG5E_34180 [Kitasatospora sp. NPDC053057]|uniref:hypothetical protein n=1 Tax=Kitasatospora sp. NPDC053057 TaxID=3364062 RepID=UPI0037CB306C